MIIVIAGIKRSASTVQFNLVRIALQMAGYKVNVCGHTYKIRKRKEGVVDLVKRHPFDRAIAEKADHVFTTDRRDKDILASLDRAWGSGDPNRIEGMRKELAAWNQYADKGHRFYYGHWVEDPMRWSKAVVEALGVDVDPAQVLERFNKIELPKEGQDPETLFFHNHITSGQ